MLSLTHKRRHLLTMLSPYRPNQLDLFSVVLQVRLILHSVSAIVTEQPVRLHNQIFLVPKLNASGMY